MALTHIFPLPKRIDHLPGDPLVLLPYPAPRLSFHCQAQGEVAQTACQTVREHLVSLFGEAALSGTDAAIAITLKIGTPPAGVQNADQGYQIEISHNAITITGFGESGLLYGAVSLRQMMRMENGQVELPQILLLDWPETKTRGHLIESRYGSDLMDIQDWTDLIDRFLSQKLNALQVNIYGCWCVQFDGKVSEYLYVPVKGHPEMKTPVDLKYFSPKENRWVQQQKLSPMYEKDYLGELIAYGKKRGVNVFPCVNSYGHNTLFPAMIPEISAKAEDGEATLTGFCTSNDKTYDFLFKFYDQIIEDYLRPNDIDTFQIGMDEVWAGIAMNANDIFKHRSPWCRCEKCRDRGDGTLFIEHAVKLAKYLKSKGMKHIYMYCDMLLEGRHDSVGWLGDDFMAAVKREGLMDEIVLQWWTYSEQDTGQSFLSTHPELGMRAVNTPWNGYYHWAVLTNPLNNIHFHAKLASQEKTEGVISYSSWDISYDRNHAVMADYFWSGYTQAGTPWQISDRYAARLFPGHAPQTAQALQLMFHITEGLTQNLENAASPTVSNLGLMCHILPYYFYSYVRAGKDYPRAFPGEALQTLSEHRFDYERAMLEITGMANRAIAIWNEAAADPGNDTVMARRYGWECEHYLCLVEDYLALLQMMDLAATPCKKRFQTIKTLAAERKNARLALMRKLEDTKEDYLLPFHMRNQSVFMQFFADLESYLANSKDKQPKLDFFDMRYLESDALRNLK